MLGGGPKPLPGVTRRPHGCPPGFVCKIPIDGLGEPSFEVVRRNPDIIVGSWCGKKFRPERVCAREGWSSIAAVGTQQIFEIKSADILQPGPAALTDGVRRLHAIVCAWAGARGEGVTDA